MIQPTQSALKARNRLLAMFLLLCILDVALVIVSQDRWAIGRILLTVVVMYFVIQGRKWAKWLLVGICSLLVVSLLALVLALSSKLSTFLIVGSLMMALLSAAIAVYMVRSKNLNHYFSYKRKANLQ
jgi:peptidoglycan/LPS O-acetylase OafA/YrhL